MGPREDRRLRHLAGVGRLPDIAGDDAGERRQYRPRRQAARRPQAAPGAYLLAPGRRRRPGPPPPPRRAPAPRGGAPPPATPTRAITSPTWTSRARTARRCSSYA